MTPQPYCPVTWWRQKPVVVVAEVYACDWAIMAYNRINNKFEGVSSLLTIMYHSRDIVSKFLSALIWDNRLHSSTVWWEITCLAVIWRVSKERNKDVPLDSISAALSGSPFRGRSALIYRTAAGKQTLLRSEYRVRIKFSNAPAMQVWWGWIYFHHLYQRR